MLQSASFVQRADHSYYAGAMQSAIRPEAPRIVDIKPLPNPLPNGRKHLARAASTSSVLTNCVPVVDASVHRAKSIPAVDSITAYPGNQNQRKPIISSINERPVTIHSASYFIPQLNSWNSGSKNKQETVREKHSSQRLKEMQDSRENMLALAEFFKKNHPPPGNYMSQHESDGEPVLNIFGKLVNRRKSGSRKKKETRLIQLPDTAVAARTIGGHRHIAISIPVQYSSTQSARINDKPLPQAPVDIRSSSLPPRGRTTKQQRGPVVVLKPVREVHESIGARIHSNVQNAQPLHKTSRADSIQPAVESPIQNASQSFQSHEATLMKKQSRSSTGGSDLSSEISMEEIEARKVASDIYADRSEIVDSNATGYSTSSESTIDGHLRGKSSVSTVESCASIDPVHHLSPSSLPRALETELRAAAAKMSAYDEFRLSTQYSSDHRDSTPEILCRELFDNPSSMVYDASACNNAGVESIPPICPPPDRKLPDLPPNDALSRTLSSGSTRTAQTVDSQSSTTLSARYLENGQLSRQESIRTKTKRPVGNTRQKSSTSNSLRSASRIAASEKRRLNDWGVDSMPQPTTDMRISNVMVVADMSPQPIKPRLATPKTSETPPRATPSRSRPRAHTKTLSTSRTTIYSPLTQTLSLTQSLTHPVHTEITTHHRSDSRASHSSASQHSNSNSNSAHELESLTSRRQARKAARNASIKDQAIEARLRRLEMDNKILLEALSGIAGGFGLLRNQGLLDRHGGKLELMGFGEGSVRNVGFGVGAGGEGEEF